MERLLTIVCAVALALIVGALAPAPVAAVPQKAKALEKESLNLLARGDYRGAALGFIRMREECQSDKLCVADAVFFLGRCRLETGRYDEAMELFNESESMYKDLGRDKDVAITIGAKAQVYAGKGDYDQAIAYYGRAEQLLKGLAELDEKELGFVHANRAITHAKRSYYEAATNDLIKARELLGRADPELLAEVDGIEALIWTQKQEYENAATVYRKLLEHHDARKNAKGRALVLNNLGHIRESQALYSQAENHYSQAIEIARRIGDRSTEGFSLNHLGSVSWKRGNFPEARQYYQQALAIRKELGQKHLYANTLNNQGLVDLAYGDYREALRRFNQSRTICEEIGAREGIAWALHDMAFVLKDTGDFTSALQFEAMAIKLSEEIKNRRLKATALLRRGNLYEYYGEFEKSLKDYAAAAQAQCEIGDILFLSNTLVDMANIYVRKQKLGLMPESLLDFDKNPCITGMVSDTYQRPDSEADDLTVAEKLYDKALELKREISAPLVELLCKYALFLIEKPQYGRSGDRAADLRRAGDLLREAEARITPSDKHNRLLLTYVTAQYLFHKDPITSRGALQQFLTLQSLARSAGSLRFSFLAHVGLGHAYERLNEPADAEKAFARGVEYAEEIRETLDEEARLTFLRGEEILGVKHVLAYEGLARVRLKREDWKGSLEASERTKARSFSDSLGRSAVAASSAVDGRLVASLAEVESQIRRNAKELDKCRGTEGAGSRVPQLEEERTALRRKREEILNRIKDQDEGYYMVVSGGYRSLDAATLGDDEWVISFEVTDSGALIYLTKGRQVVLARLANVPRTRIDALIGHLRAAFEATDPFSFDMAALRAGKDLFSTLLSPIIEALPPNKPVIIVPDDSLGVVPFEMLTTSESGRMLPGKLLPRIVDAEFFGDRNPLSYAQSITALTLARERDRKRKTAGQEFLIIADPLIRCRGAGTEELARDRLSRLELDLSVVDDPQYAVSGSRPMGLLSPQQCTSIQEMPRLDETGRLAGELSREFTGTEVYTGERASLAAFLRQLSPRMGGFGKVLFATHAILGGQFAGLREPALLLSNVPVGTDSWLRMRNIAGLTMNAEVVVLLACQTGLGKLISGEGTMGMGRAFQLAGSRSVLMSLWMVDETASVTLAGAFFRYLREGRSKIEALRLAREDLRKAQGGMYDHPFFWAGFILAGERE